MLKRNPGNAPILISVLALAVLSATTLPALVAAKQATGSARAAPPELLREVPDDPPAPPAQPLPGAPRAATMRVSLATTHQANVDANGANIPGDAANEPSIAVNPLQPNSIAIGWRQFDNVSSNFRQGGWGYSEDGGRTWTFPGVLEPGVFRSDPVLGFDQDGNFYYSSLSGNFLVDIWKSIDSGATWLPPVDAWGGDKQWIALDRTGGIGTGNLYQTWSIAAGCCGNDIFTRSTDGVQSFEVPINVPNEPVWGTMDVAPDGTLFIAGANIHTFSDFYVVKSTNAQDPGATPTFDLSTIDLGGSIGFSLPPNPGGLSGQVWLAVDPSNGPTAGWIYVMASVDPPGPDPLDVHFVFSWDGGHSWSPWARINDDASGPNNWQWFATMSVAPNGRIDAVWNDTRDTGASNFSALYYASSTDGGITWSANERISTWWDSHIGWPNQQKIGDYYHMISDRVGAHLAWAATFNGEQDVYYTRIGDYDCNSNGVPDTLDIQNGTSPDNNHNGIPDECEGATSVAEGGAPGPRLDFALQQNTPNPFNPSTEIRFDAPVAGAQVSLEVFDSDGRHVRTLLDGTVGAGRRAVVWDGRDERGRHVASGVYFYQLEATGGVRETRSMLLVK